jgi:hypothetical protein
MFNAKARKAFMEVTEKSDALMKKHKVKLLGSWDVPNEHTSYNVYEAPSFEAFKEFGMEPAIVALGEFLTMEVKPAMSPEETTQMLKHMK